MAQDHSARQACSGTVEVHAVYGNDLNVRPPYMQNSKVLVGGDVRITLKAEKGYHKYLDTSNGKAVFEDVPCGPFKIEATYNGKGALVETAKQMVGSTAWAFSASRTTFDGTITLERNTNKCNIFVYDVIQKTFGQAPTYSYYRKGIKFDWFKRTVPALAGSWADENNSASDPTPNWKNHAYRDKGRAITPGSILAIALPTGSVASGHVSVISYPMNGLAFDSLRGGRKQIDVIMPGMTISASGKEVVENEWGFRTSRSPEHESLNSPDAGIEGFQGFKK